MTLSETVDLYPSRLEPHPDLIERRDPVIHGDPGTGPLTSAQLDQYDRQGFLVLENLFSPSQTRAFQHEADRLRARPEDVRAETLIEEPGDAASEVRSVFAIHEQSRTFTELSEDERLTELARQILGDEIYIHQSRLNYKPAFRGKEFYWHSDFETWHVEDGMPRMRALSMSVMLTDNFPEAGPTMFIPGSHRKYVCCVGETPEDHFKSSLRKQEYGVPDDDSLAAMAADAVGACGSQYPSGVAAPAPKAGSVVIFDCNTMHGSGGNITPFERVNAFFVFNAWSNRLAPPFGGVKPRPDYIAKREPAAPLPKRHNEAA